MPQAVREYRRELLRLYLELIIPLISVVTLVVVTVLALEDAFDKLNLPADGPEDDVDVNLMMLFSGMNLLLDIVDVTCFGRAHQAFGLSDIRRESATYSGSVRNVQNSVEMESLLREGESQQSNGIADPSEQMLVNLNMCSAWTVSSSVLKRNPVLPKSRLTFELPPTFQHICADTMRSTAVLVAATVAHFFQNYVSGVLADSMAAIVVSIIILVSLIPLHGLFNTARKTIELLTDPMRPVM
jgi:Co/Zn/Cd efflux system component